MANLKAKGFVDKNGNKVQMEPAPHEHTIAEVDGLQTALNGKAASSHSHAISDITSLQNRLNERPIMDDGIASLGPIIVEYAGMLKKSNKSINDVVPIITVNNLDDISESDAGVYKVRHVHLSTGKIDVYVLYVNWAEENTHGVYVTQYLFNGYRQKYRGKYLGTAEWGVWFEYSIANDQTLKFYLSNSPYDYDFALAQEAILLPKSNVTSTGFTVSTNDQSSLFKLLYDDTYRGGDTLVERSPTIQFNDCYLYSENDGDEIHERCTLIDTVDGLFLIRPESGRGVVVYKSDVNFAEALTQWEDTGYLTFNFTINDRDTTPTSGSGKLITSGGVYEALAALEARVAALEGNSSSQS